MGALPPQVHSSLIADRHLVCLGNRTKWLYARDVEIWFNPA